MKSPAPDRRPYAWLEDDFGTNFGRKQEPLQPRIDRTPAAIRNPMLQPFRNGPEKVTVGWALISKMGWGNNLLQKYRMSKKDS